jgi:hypothetical protein
VNTDLHLFSYFNNAWHKEKVNYKRLCKIAPYEKIRGIAFKGRELTVQMGSATQGLTRQKKWGLNRHYWI